MLEHAHAERLEASATLAPAWRGGPAAFAVARRGLERARAWRRAPCLFGVILGSDQSTALTKTFPALACASGANACAPSIVG